LATLLISVFISWIVGPRTITSSAVQAAPSKEELMVSTRMMHGVLSLKSNCCHSIGHACHSAAFSLNACSLNRMARMVFQGLLSSRAFRASFCSAVSVLSR